MNYLIKRNLFLNRSQ